MIIEPKTRRWWNLLRTASIVNLLLWSAVALTTDLSITDRLAQVVLSGVYTFVCAYRSFYPRIDLEHTVLLDNWLSSIALGRSAATIAEMCFTLQLALILLQFADGLPWLKIVALAMVIVITIAQTACWLGILSGNHLWHAVEESLWALMVVMIIIALIGIWPQVDDWPRSWLVIGLIGCFGAVYVMVGLDVPMYIRRWRDERQNGKADSSVRQGFSDAVHRRHATGRWDVWRHEVAWMTPYFTVCVWLSLGLAKFGP